MYTHRVSFRILVKGGKMMYSRGNYQHAKHADARGVWGHAGPTPRKFLKMDALRLNLRAFQSQIIRSFQWL